MNIGGFVTPTLDIRPALGNTPSRTNRSANSAAVASSPLNSINPRFENRSHAPTATIRTNPAHSHNATPSHFDSQARVPVAGCAVFGVFATAVFRSRLRPYRSAVAHILSMHSKYPNRILSIGKFAIPKYQPKSGSVYAYLCSKISSALRTPVRARSFNNPSDHEAGVVATSIPPGASTR